MEANGSKECPTAALTPRIDEESNRKTLGRPSHDKEISAKLTAVLNKHWQTPKFQKIIWQTVCTTFGKHDILTWKGQKFTPLEQQLHVGCVHVEHETGLRETSLLHGHELSKRKEARHEL